MFTTAEAYAGKIDDVLDSEIYQFMGDQHYELLAWLRPSLIFRDTRCVQEIRPRDTVAQETVFWRDNT